MKRKSVYFCMSCRDTTEWYSFDVSEDDRKITVPCICNCGCRCAKRIRHDTQGSPFLLPRAVLPHEDGWRPGWAILKNQLYRLGGTNTESFERQSIKTVSCLDLTSNSNSNNGGDNDDIGRWRRKPRMLARRGESQTVVVGGRLYVLGGHIDDYPWAEVYDPASKSWEALRRPPFAPRQSFHSAGLEDEDGKNGCILVLYVHAAVLLEYNVANESWKKHKLAPEVADLSDQDVGGPAIAVGRVLYWFSPYTCCLYGLHLDTHVLYTSEVVVDVPRHGHGNPMLGHLEGHKFFLLHPNYDLVYGDDSSHPAPPLLDGSTTRFLHCLKFSISFIGGQRMSVSPESSQSFVIKHESSFLGCSVM
ncbi:hypothetical protein Tsubulata_036406 [Turnera subulata]|uniref:Uncharacterized protein n=1 Tax=Turnera subulata TaxID=218843 RepID=A0A9Q0F8E1_9ROSI|nr:hypothetical protein Tsubulata_036406 [Turnera subulata]